MTAPSRINPRAHLAALLFGCGLVLAAPLASGTGAQIQPLLKSAQAALSAGDYQTSFTQFSELAAHYKEPMAQFTLGLFYQQGWGRAVDLAEACDWYILAAPEGPPLASYRAGECYASGHRGTPDFAQAVAYFDDAGAAGYGLAWCAAAEIYLHQWRQPQRALSQCLRAAEQGIVAAQLQTANYLAHGDPLIRDRNAAHYWYLQAANSGSSEAAYQLAQLLSQTHRRQAGFWFEVAASGGLLDAYFPTADFYFSQFNAAPLSDSAEAYLAKTYLWLCALQQRDLDHPDQSPAAAMRAAVEAIMPTSWQAALNEQVALHLQQFTRTTVHTDALSH